MVAVKKLASGPGGHSWGDFGIVNPVHALGRAIARFAAYPAPVSPRTSYNVGVIEGGNSVNSIPERARMIVDMRSTSNEEIERLREVQIDLLQKAASRLKAGGSLVYSTCSLEPEENGEVVRQFLAARPGFRLEIERELLPFRDGVDGAYAARLVSAGA